MVGRPTLAYSRAAAKNLGFNRGLGGTFFLRPVESAARECCLRGPCCLGLRHNVALAID